MRVLSIIGSTGSIGTQTLEVVRRNPEDFRVAGLACGSDIDLLYKQIEEFSPEAVSVADPSKAEELRSRLQNRENDYKKLLSKLETCKLYNEN